MTNLNNTWKESGIKWHCNADGGQQALYFTSGFVTSLIVIYIQDLWKNISAQQAENCMFKGKSSKNLEENETISFPDFSIIF